MEKKSLKGRILSELESLISRSCHKGRTSGHTRRIHQLIVQKHYNATAGDIDYHRQRVTLELVSDEQAYHPGRLNINLTTFRANLMFGNLKDFLKSCVETDNKSLAFYAWLLRTYDKKDVPFITV
jgi:hypothetical protein